jgi:tetratricopeptide (TPR) repeat protein
MGFLSGLWKGVKKFVRDLFGDDPPPPPPPAPVIVVQTPDTVQQDLRKMEESHRQGIEELKRRLEKAEQERNQAEKRQIEEDLRREHELYKTRKEDGERRLREARLRQQQELRDREEEARQFAGRVMQAVDRAAKLHQGGEHMRALKRLERIEQQLQKTNLVELLPPDVFDLVSVHVARVQADIGALYMRQRHFEEAARCFDTYLVYFPDDTKRWFDRARAKLGAGHVADAVELVRERLRSFDDSVGDDLAKLIRAFADEGRSELAASVLKEELAREKSLPQQALTLRLLTELHTAVSPQDLRQYLDVLLRMGDYATALHLARTMTGIPPAACLAIAILAESPEAADPAISISSERRLVGSTAALSLALSVFTGPDGGHQKDLHEESAAWWKAVKIDVNTDRKMVADRLKSAFADVGVPALTEWPVSWRLALFAASGLALSMCHAAKWEHAHVFAKDLLNLYELGSEDKSVAPPPAVVSTLIRVFKICQDFGRSDKAEDLRQPLLAWLGEEEFRRRMSDRLDDSSSVQFSDRFECVNAEGRSEEIYRNGVCWIMKGRFRHNLERAVEILNFSPIFVRREAHIAGFRMGFEEQRHLTEGPDAVPGVQKLLGYDVCLNKAQAALEPVTGRRLSEFISDVEVDEIPIDQLAALVESLTRVIGGIHRSGKAVGQPRPENIFFDTEGAEVTVTGIGIYRPFEQSGSSSTKDKAFTQYRLNSFLYSAPEGPGTAEADQYSLAGMLYHLLVREPPFQCKDAAVLKRLHKREKVPKIAVKGLEHFFQEDKGGFVRVELPDIAIRRPSLGYALDPIFRKALDPNPKNRYTSIDEFGRDLAARLRGIDRRKSLGRYSGDLKGLINLLCTTLDQQGLEGEIRIRMPASALNDIGRILGRPSNPCKILVVYPEGERPRTLHEGAEFRFLKHHSNADEHNEVFIMLPHGMNFYYLIDERRNQEDQFRRRIDQFDRDFEASGGGDAK